MLNWSRQNEPRHSIAEVVNRLKIWNRINSTEVFSIYSFYMLENVLLQSKYVLDFRNATLTGKSVFKAALQKS